MKRAIIKTYSPKQVEQIINGKMLIDICKKIPKEKLPIDVYIYETLGKLKTVKGLTCGYTGRKIISLKEYEGRGKVVGKFTLENISIISFEQVSVDSEALVVYPSDYEIVGDKSDLLHFVSPYDYKLYEKACIDIEDYKKYSNNGEQKLFAWHITNLVIFGKSMELGEFERYLPVKEYKNFEDNKGKYKNFCKGCKHKYFDYTENTTYCPLCDDGYCPKLKITKAPQSWCYVEVEE